ncbi:hypothetical protein [Accumulibacter sp.]|uniref:hypothetical protein n=1 Tax=Accumulibacter sp. TaxID=2053492 RepID=UPI0025E6B3BA|nr:hypothetical protein [Accumulibacter sp.]MCM8593952.1 hypothetical protein [Accumulibacter sp.]MCM8627801.1 hypothetical protein [Accumulibacter sp.]MDS4048093.1 hypothetical protein [Accumulibacter sp.]
MNDRYQRKHNARQRARIAALAGRLIAEDGINDPTLAKRKAARLLRLPDRASLPDDLEVEAELRTHQRLFQGQEQQDRNAFLLRTAAQLMSKLLRFNPYLTGSVLEGSAGRYGEIDIQLFTDSAKDVEIFLLNESMDFRHSVPRTDRAEAVLTLVGAAAVANLIIYPRDEERVSPRTRDGRVRERARLDAVNRLISDSLDRIG